MLKEFKKINNPRQQRKYLDKIALTLNKQDLTDEQVMEIIELNDYLEEIRFWDKYTSLFDEVVKKAKTKQIEKEANEKKDSLTSAQLEQYYSTVSILFDYDKDVVVDCFDKNKKPVCSLLVRSKAYPEKDRWESKVKMSSVLLDLIKNKGSLEIHYFNGRRVLKRIKL